MHPKKERTILLVEDQIIIAQAEQGTIEEWGYRVRLAHSGEAAVEAVEADPDIDLVLMDIDLGSGLSGDEAARRILSIRHLPIVFLTSHTEREFVEGVQQITRYGYVLKDSGRFVLRNAIEVAFELFEARRELDRVFLVNPDLLCVSDTQGALIKVNDAWEKTLSYSACEMEGKAFFDFVHPDDIEATRSVLGRLVSGEEITSFANRYRCKAGSYRKLEWHARRCAGRIYAAARDVTEREDVLTEYETIFDGTDIAMFLVEVTDAKEFRYLRNNRFHQKLTGLSAEELRGKTPQDILGKEAGDAVVENYRRCLAEKGPVSYTVTLSLPEGVRTRHTTIKPVLRDGEVRQLVGWTT